MYLGQEVAFLGRKYKKPHDKKNKVKKHWEKPENLICKIKIS